MVHYVVVNRRAILFVVAHVTHAYKSAGCTARDIEEFGTDENSFFFS